MAKEISKEQAKKIKAAAKRVEAHRADRVGFLRQSFDLAGSLVKLLSDAYVESDMSTANEIRTLLLTLRRFRKTVLKNQQAQTAALTQALGHTTALEKLLEEAQGKGYALKRLNLDAERDMGATKRLRANLQQRTQEAAFVLAELEQAVDPLPGLKIASAKVRRENEKRRKAAKPKQDAEVELKPDALTSKPIERSEIP